MSDIAIVGYSFKLPQGVEDDDAFWEVLENRRNLMTDWPESRVKTDSFANNKDQKWNGKGGHFINDDVAAFDAPFFSLTAKEASTMDPMQRWTLEATYHAFENAGLPVDSLKGSRTAVFSASMLEDYSRMTAVDPDNLERTAVTGSTVSCIIPNRVSCLSAVDMACKALKSGDASCAVVTGANLLLDPSIFQVLANQGFLSPDGVCYSFDERANGYARGEGVIAVVLKPVQAAIENGDMIRAVIRSISSNQDGHTPILTQPSSQSQEELIRHVYKQAGLSLSDTRYVEAHERGGSKLTLAVMLEKGVIPPNALLQNINPALNVDSYKITVPTKSIEWPAEGLRRVSLNSFGFGGSNSHIVLDDALHYLQDRGLSGIHHTSLIPRPVTNGSGVTNGDSAARTNGTNRTNGVANGHSDVELPKLLVWTAADEKAAKRTIGVYGNFHREKVFGTHKKLDCLASTLGARRSNMLWRAFSVVDGIAEQPLSLSKPIRSSEDIGLAFVFTGQGAQYINMGLGLEQYPVYRETLEKISEIYSSLGCSWNLFDELSCGENINMPQYSQPLATAVQIALIDLLASFGITPKVVTGHSSGEIAAAYASGGLSLESACRVSYFRGLLAGRLREANASSPGAMLSINLAPHHVSEYLEKIDITTVNVACINSPLNVTLSGSEDAIEKVKSQTDQDGIFAQKLKTGVAYHSPSMKAMSDQADIFYSDLFRNLCADGQLKYLLDLASHENPALRVLEVGAGTGGMTGHVISALQEREKRIGGLAFSEYTYTDISPAFFETASQRWPDLKSQNRITFKTLDLDRSIDSQGFEPGYYDLVIAASVLHATPYLEATIRNVRKALKPGGRLILLEVINPEDIATNFMAGLVPGWWVAREEWRPHSAAIPEHLWDKCLKDNGFSGNDLVIRDYQDDQWHIMSVIVTTASEPEQKVEEMVGKGRLVLLISDKASTKERELADQVHALIDPGKGRRITVVPFSPAPVQNELASLTTDDLVICLAEAGDKPLLSNLSEEQFNCLQLLISKVSNLLWVTSPNNRSPEYPDYNVAQGFFRSIRAEQPDTHIVTLAIDGEIAQASQAGFISEVYKAAFETETPSKEVEYTVRDGAITTGRAIRDMETDTALRSLVSKQLQQRSWGEGPALKLGISQPGTLDSLQFVEDKSHTEELGAHDVEIEAMVWGLTSRDLEIALGHTDKRTEDFGSDCVGVVTRIGESCSTTSRIGDRVAMVSPGCMRKYPRANELCVFKIPKSVSFKDAVSLTLPGLTACHLVLNIACVQENDKVLIHSAADIAGQSAVMLAQKLGAQVFATVATAAEKQLLMNTSGLTAEHIFNSNSASLSQDIMRVTEGEGVDVLPDFSQDILRTPLSCVTDGGRVVSVGNRDKSDASTMAAEIMSRNLTFSSIDILRLKPKVLSQLVQTMVQLLAEDKVQLAQALPSFKVSDIKDGFKELQEENAIERVIVTVEPGDVVPQFVQDHRPWIFHGNSTYLVAGGSGGLGRAIIRWMADRGAKHLIVPSRSGATSQAAAHLLAELASRGVNIVAPKCDVSVREDVTAMLEECSRTMPPIKGCINAAMVLQDAIFQSNMTFQQWNLTMRSKINTSKNLHELLPKDLDFFILLSSLAGVVGQMASANYASGCAYQDALAKYRRAQGQSALSLDIGWMSNIGIIAEKEAYQRQRQASNDLQPIDDKELLALLTLCCDPNNPISLPPLSEGQVLFGLRTPADILEEGQQPPALLERTLLSAFSFLAGNNNTPVQIVDHAESAREVFQKSSDTGEWQQVVMRAIAAKLARAMSISPDDVESSKPLSSYGVDSLMAVELRNWINKEFISSVAVFDIIGSTSIAGVAKVVETRSSI
ncbi:polyketide synthase [Fusarium pseudocircinatum]|uniref:Polyketide synthase n=1 Tax=Fusarium pseudocircinatum TaxID=56676 RepID=A0A8H5LDG3_9HYPO|nr:polyketide synthase [Fusarium pseudocircinatum]